MNANMTKLEIGKDDKENDKFYKSDNLEKLDDNLAKGESDNLINQVNTTLQHTHILVTSGPANSC